MSIKTKSIGALFVVLVVILAMNPMLVNNIYNTILGRLFLIGIVIFFAMNNITLGLLVTLTIIAALNQFGSLVEGMDNAPTTVGDDNVVGSGSGSGVQQVLTKSAVAAMNTSTDTSTSPTINDLKTQVANGSGSVANGSVANGSGSVANGVDKEDIKNAIMSKDSKTIPIDPNTMKSSEDVSAYKPAMLTNSSSLTEGFCPCAGTL